MPAPAGVGAAVVGLGLLLALPGPAAGDRIFYAGRTWLETSPAVQRLSLHGVFRAWGQLAEAAEERPLSVREEAFVRLHRCVTATGHTTGELIEWITAVGRRAPARTYYSLSDFVAESLRELCRGPAAAGRAGGLRLSGPGGDEGPAGRGQPDHQPGGQAPDHQEREGAQGQREVGRAPDGAGPHRVIERGQQ